MTDSWYVIKIQKEVKEMMPMSTVEIICQKYRKGIPILQIYREEKDNSKTAKKVY